MKIIVNSIPLLSPLTGVGRYLFSILKNIKKIDMKNKYYFYYGIGIADMFLNKRPDFWELLPWKKFSFVSKYGIPTLKYIYRFLSINKFLQTSTGYKVDRLIRYCIKKYIRPLFNFDNIYYDVYFEPNFIPLNEIKAKKIVTTIHDFSFYLYPQWHPKDRVMFFASNFWKNIYRADVIITVSNFVKQQAEEFIKGFHGEIVSIYNGYDDEQFKVLDKNFTQEYKKHRKLPENFILFVGSVEPRKNLVGLLKAYKLLSEYIRKDVKLVIAGFRGWKNNEVRQMLAELANDVYYLGYVGDFDLTLLYNLAVASIYPSFYEGFGLPNIESMACGCPVVTSDIPTIKEVCQDAVYYVNPYDIESIKEGILNVIENSQLRQQLKIKGLQQVKKFSWEISARKHLEVFNNLK